MTTIELLFGRFRADGSLGPVPGKLIWTPLRHAVTGSPDAVVLPLPFTVTVPTTIDSAPAEAPIPFSINVAPSGPDWVWKVEESFIGVRPRRIYVTVPDVASVNYNDLVQVDISTLAPLATPEPAWYAYVETMEAAVLETKGLIDASAAAAAAAQTSATGSQTSASASAALSATKASDAGTSAFNAATSAATALGHKNDAAASAAAALTTKTETIAVRDATTAIKDTAAGSASAAAGSATAAAGSATTATQQAATSTAKATEATLAANGFTLGTVTTVPGAQAAATITGVAPNRHLNLDLPVATLSVGTVETLPGALNDTAIAYEVANGTATKAALNATYGLKRTFDVKSYGAKGDGTTDDIAAITNAINDAMAAGGGIVYFPAGTYRISAAIPAHSGIVYQGAGRSFTTIKPYQSAAFTGSGTISAPITDAEWRDMTWDGANITISGYKGQYSAYMLRCKWTNVRCINFTATGFGSDFLVDCVYERCTSSYNGRLAALDAAGMSGFGIGTGMYQVENTILKGCSAVGNTNYGIFFEKQGADTYAPYRSYGVQVVGCYLDSNGYGLGGCGVDSPVYTGNIIRASVRDGIILGAGTGVSPLGMPDQRAVITGNNIFGNGRDGIRLDYGPNSFPAANARHIISSNNVRQNAGNGLTLLSAKWAESASVVRGIKAVGNKFTGNTGDGIYVVQTAGAEAGATVADLHLEENDVNANGGSGIHLNVPLTRPVVKGNICYDDQTVQTQVNGIVTDAGFTITDATIKDNILLGNKTNAALFNGTWAGDTSVRGNRGYVPGWASITVGASPFTYTCGVTPEVIYWAGGATSAVKITPKGSTQATVLLAAGAETIPLLPGDAVEFTYTAGPTSLKTIKQQ